MPKPKKQTIYTKTGFAKLCGVTRTAVFYAVTQGRLIVNEDNKIDIEHPLNAEYKRIKDAGESATPVGPRGNKTKTAPAGTFSGDNVTKADIDKQKTLAQIEKLNIENETKRKELIDRKLVARVFTEIHTVDVQQIVPLKDKLVADIAAIFGVSDDKLMHQARAAAEKEIYRALKHRKRILDDFVDDPWREKDEMGAV
jgi:hypothetical protein